MQLAGFVVKILLASDDALFLFLDDRLVSPVGLQFHTAEIVVKVRFENSGKPGFAVGVFNWNHQLDAAIKISPHPVG